MKTPKTNKRISKPSDALARSSMQRRARCDHHWNYEHLLWQAREGREEVAVGRYCVNCGKLETSVARNWHSLPKSYVDMRETLEASLKASSGRTQRQQEAE